MRFPMILSINSALMYRDSALVLLDSATLHIDTTALSIDGMMQLIDGAARLINGMMASQYIVAPSRYTATAYAHLMMFTD